MNIFDQDIALDILEMARGGRADYAAVRAILEVGAYVAALVEEQRLANLIALLNPELSTWEHIDNHEIARRVREFLDGTVNR